jgi:putative ABC transport system substrate-binding protein
VVGYLSSELRDQDALRVRAFRQGLSETGYLEGKNVAIEYRWAGGQYERLPELAADLVRRHVHVIATIGGSRVGFAAKSATATAPVIFGVGTDPVEAGLVGSLNRPEGNLTGVTILSAGLFEKRVELLRELVPNATAVAMLTNPNNQSSHAETRGAENGARSLGLELRVLNASSWSDIELAFTSLANSPANALIVDADAFIATRKPQIIARAAWPASASAAR